MSRAIVLVTFDLIRPGEPEVAYAAASLLTALRADAEISRDYRVRHLGVNLLDDSAADPATAAQAILEQFDMAEIEALAVGCYVWNEHHVQALIAACRRGGYVGKIIVGGPQVTYADQSSLPSMYPGVDIFVVGYGERELVQAIKATKRVEPWSLTSEPTDVHNLPSPYLAGDITIRHGQGMVRAETKRGCTFRCSFCAHREIRTGSVTSATGSRVQAEMEFFIQHQVRKINYLDPIFNQGTDYLSHLGAMAASGLQARVALQARFELVAAQGGTQFLDLISQLDGHLEFGLQTVSRTEGQAIHRNNNVSAVETAMRMLHDAGTSYEVSLIYGLPGQTVESFRSSIAFLTDNGCRHITAFPLMLLRGTELHHRRDEWKLKDRPHGRFGIPTVYASSTFDEDDWGEMRRIAEGLDPNQRV